MNEQINQEATELDLPMVEGTEIAPTQEGPIAEEGTEVLEFVQEDNA